MTKEWKFISDGVMAGDCFVNEWFNLQDGIYENGGFIKLFDVTFRCSSRQIAAAIAWRIIVL